jgi:Fe-S-cluster-containing hydrogenase component 2
MKHKYLKNVVTLKLIQEKCIGCEMCLNVCPHGVFELKVKHKLLIKIPAWNVVPAQRIAPA